MSAQDDHRWLLGLRSKLEDPPESLNILDLSIDREKQNLIRNLSIVIHEQEYVDGKLTALLDRCVDLYMRNGDYALWVEENIFTAISANARAKFHELWLVRLKLARPLTGSHGSSGGSAPAVASDTPSTIPPPHKPGRKHSKQ